MKSPSRFIFLFAHDLFGKPASTFPDHAPMGRLALDARHRGRGHGEFLHFDAFSRALRSEIATYAFVVDAKDDKAAEFYRRYRFLPLVAGGRRFFIPMAEIAKLFAQ